MILPIQGEVHVQIDTGHPLRPEEVRQGTQVIAQGRGPQKGEGLVEGTLGTALDAQESRCGEIRDDRLSRDQGKAPDTAAAGRDGEALIVVVAMARR